VSSLRCWRAWVWSRNSRAMVVIVDNDGTIQFSKANYDVDEDIGEAVIDVVRTGSTNRAQRLTTRSSMGPRNRMDIRLRRAPAR